MIQWSLLLSHRHLPLWLFALKNEKSISNLHSAFKKKRVLWFFMENLCTQNSFLCHSAIQLPPWHVLSLDKNQPSPQLSIHQPYPKKNKSVPQFFSWLVFLTLKKKTREKTKSPLGRFPHDGKCNSKESFRFVEVRIVCLKSSKVTFGGPVVGCVVLVGKRCPFWTEYGETWNEIFCKWYSNGKMWWFDKLNEEIFWGMTLLIL